MAVPADGPPRIRSTASATSQNRQPSIRIVIVNDVFHPDDPTADAALDRFTTLTGWATALRGHGADVVVCQRFHSDAEVVRDGVGYHFIADSYPARPSSSFAGSARMSDLVRSLKPTVVHVNGLSAPRAIRRLRSALNSRSAIVVQDHGGFDPRRLSVLRRRWMRRGLSVADVLLVATPEQVSVFRESGLVPARVSIRDVMEGSTTFRRTRSRAPAATLKILWVGRLNANKDPLTVLQGFARFAAARTDARLTFVYGTTELESALRDAVQSSGDLKERVTLAGPMPHSALEAVYNDADLFVLGSHREGSGYAALEAMACGVVPVLTDIPSFRGLTDDGRVGALWKPGDPTSLAAALQRVTRHGAFESQRDACRRRFEDCFSWDAIGARAMAIYRECSAR